MSIHSIHEIYASLDEEAVACYWWSLPRGSILPLTNGDAYQLFFAGRPGGAAGPDVRDAVLCGIHPRLSLLDQGMRKVLHARKYCGDVEFHVRSSDWIAHQHHTDARYNNVVLHVILFCDDASPTLKQDGLIVPTCSLCDLPANAAQSPIGCIPQDRTHWPCQGVLQRMIPEARARLLEDAGLFRFEQKVHAFVEQLHASGSTPQMSPLATIYDACLLPALAEGLGYGRNRDFFRAVGLCLSGQGTAVPEPLGRAPAPAPLDAGRLQSLRLLVERGRSPGLWQKLRTLVQLSQLDDHAYQTLNALRIVFRDVGLSLARADILIINVVLPFAAAVGLLEHDTLLSEHALMLYKLHPGLPSNWITRMMSVQLQLPSEPRGSCQQQGLHYIYRETCREKCCDMCIVGKESAVR